MYVYIYIYINICLPSIIRRPLGVTRRVRYGLYPPVVLPLTGAPKMYLRAPLSKPAPPVCTVFWPRECHCKYSSFFIWEFEGEALLNFRRGWGRGGSPAPPQLQEGCAGGGG